MLSDNGWSAIIAIFLIFCCDTTSSECTQLTPCSCVGPDGYGFDLSSLKHLGYLQTQLTKNVTFLFRPCENYKFPPINQTNECSIGNGASLCMYNATSNKNISLGTAEETTMQLLLKNPVLTLHHEKLTASIELLCCETCTTQFSENPDKQGVAGEYHLLLMSTSACKVMHARYLSTGSVLVILLFVFSGLYFVGGAIALKMFRGATGWEMVPNHEFWSDLPSLVKEGVQFTFRSCKPVSYDRI